MISNFTGFCEIIHLENEKTADFVRTFLNDLNTAYSSTLDYSEYVTEDDLIASKGYLELDKDDQRSVLNIYNLYQTSKEVKQIYNNGSVGFDWSYEGVLKTPCYGKYTLKIFSNDIEGDADVESLFLFLKYLWKSTGRTDSIVVCYSLHCTRAIVGDFGGGAILVGKDFAEIISISDIAEKRITDLTKS